MTTLWRVGDCRFSSGSYCSTFFLKSPLHALHFAYIVSYIDLASDQSCNTPIASVLFRVHYGSVKCPIFWCIRSPIHESLRYSRVRRFTCIKVMSCGISQDRWFSYVNLPFISIRRNPFSYFQYPIVWSINVNLSIFTSYTVPTVFRHCSSSDPTLIRFELNRYVSTTADVTFHVVMFLWSINDVRLPPLIHMARCAAQCRTLV